MEHGGAGIVGFRLAAMGYATGNEVFGMYGGTEGGTVSAFLIISFDGSTFYMMLDTLFVYVHVCSFVRYAACHACNRRLSRGAIASPLS